MSKIEIDSFGLIKKYVFKSLHQNMYLNFSPMTVENFREIVQMICDDDMINMAIAENIVYEVIKCPTISARKVSITLFPF